MSEMNEIKNRMEDLEKNQAQDSKNLEGLLSRLDQIEAELHKGKNDCQKGSQRSCILGGGRSKKGYIRRVQNRIKQTQVVFRSNNYHISWQCVKGRSTILKFKPS